MALAVSDAGNGGQVLLSETTMQALGAEALRDSLGVVHMGEFKFKDDGDGAGPSVALYLALPHELLPARLVALPPVRCARQTQAGALQVGGLRLGPSLVLW